MLIWGEITFGRHLTESLFPQKRRNLISENELQKGSWLNFICSTTDMGKKRI